MPSVIVCCHSLDRLTDTLLAIDSILAQTLEPHEVIVSVDNNTQLAAVLQEERPAVRVVLNLGPRGSCATRNAALDGATGDIVAFVDHDVVAEPDWLARLVQAFQDREVMVVGGQSVAAWEGGGQGPRWFPRECEFMIGCTGHLDLLTVEGREIRNPGAGNMAVRKLAFEIAGGWENGLGRGPTKTGGEEAELCLRIKTAMPDSLVVYEPSAIVHHKVPRERGTLKYVFTYAYNEGVVRAMVKKYVAPHTKRPLDGERRYLRSLIVTAVPSRLKRFYRPGALEQIGVIAVNALLIAVGYARGRLSYR